MAEKAFGKRTDADAVNSRVEESWSKVTRDRRCCSRFRLFAFTAVGVDPVLSNLSIRFSFITHFPFGGSSSGLMGLTKRYFGDGGTARLLLDDSSRCRNERDDIDFLLQLEDEIRRPEDVVVDSARGSFAGQQAGPRIFIKDQSSGAREDENGFLALLVLETLVKVIAIEGVAVKIARAVDLEESSNSLGRASRIVD